MSLVEEGYNKRNRIESLESPDLKEKKELIEWIKQIVSKNTMEYTYFEGELKNKEIYISYKDNKYVPKYVDAIDFIQVIREVTDEFNKTKKHRVVSATPRREGGKIDIYVF